MTDSRRTIFLFTRFPVATETFLQREVRALLAQNRPIELISLWGGATQFEGYPVHAPGRMMTFARGFPALWPWLARQPGPLRRWSEALWEESPPNPVNLGENLWAVCAAANQLPRLRRAPPAHLHAVWGSMPATVAWLLGDALDIPWSMAAHAYDLFDDGGDWLMREKLRHCRFVRTSTEAGVRRLQALGAPPERVHRIRRGLPQLPALSDPRGRRRPLRLLSVGRLVEKKGFLNQLRIHAAVRDAGIEIAVRILGDGPMRSTLEREIVRLDLADTVTLEGARPYSEVEEAYRWADVFIFTGMIAAKGDRDGLPNVIAEAMGHGVPVLSTPVGGIPEAVQHEESGCLLSASEPCAWVKTLRRIQEDDHHYRKIQQTARAWVEREFDLHRNVTRLWERIAAESRFIQ